MLYVSILDRTQMMMCSWDSFVDAESIARLIDAFVYSFDLVEMLFWTNPRGLRRFGGRQSKQRCFIL